MITKRMSGEFSVGWSGAWRGIGGETEASEPELNLNSDDNLDVRRKIAMLYKSFRSNQDLKNGFPENGYQRAMIHFGLSEMDNMDLPGSLPCRHGPALLPCWE